MGKSKKMEKMSVLDEFFDSPDSYISPEISQESLDLIKEQTRLADVPIQQKIEKEPTQSRSIVFNKIQKGSIEFNQSGSIEANKVHQKGSIEFIQSRSIVLNKAQKGSKEFNQSGSIEANKVQISSMNSIEPSIGEGKILRWLNEKKLEDLTVLFKAEECSVETGFTKEGCKTAIKRLKIKGFIELLESRRGRYTAFGLYKITSKGDEFLKKAPAPFNWVQSRSIGFSNRVQIGSYSSSNNINIINTTIRIPEPLSSLVSAKEVEEFVSKGLFTKNDLEQSLEHFSYDYSNGLVKSKSNPISLLYGLCRAGKIYRSVKLIEIENQELRDYEKSLQQAEAENLRLRDIDLRKKFEAYKAQNPNFLEAFRTNQRFAVSDEIIENLAFEKFKQNET